MRKFGISAGSKTRAKCLPQKSEQPLHGNTGRIAAAVPVFSRHPSDFQRHPSSRNTGSSHFPSSGSFPFPYIQELRCIRKCPSVNAFQNTSTF
ncbi:hypothetical protein EAJ17_04410 [Akkermansia sp. aa_0143]|nr:hypothetical protein EAJ17_04410 [Akkermansia sp. aa_0143]